MSVDLAAAPFCLDEAGRDWVRSTLETMSMIDKVGQLFCEIVWEREADAPERLFDVITPGAVMYRPFTAGRMNEISRALQDAAPVPLLIASNLERGGRGGNGGMADGTYIASPMGLAATDDPVHAFRTGLVSGREGATAGINWTFEPIVDLDLNPHNPITNVRTFGSDPDRVIAMAKAYIDGCRAEAMAVTLKHFPGDGVDFRDQHLLASVNSLDEEAWFATFGRVYQELIDHGAHAVMVSHILQPALCRAVDPHIGDRDILPASLSKELIEGVLRGRLGFNGVVVTDATQMVGFTASMERSRAVPAAIANGCDMFLFTINQREDVDYMLRGVNDGRISAQRLDDAVTRILALKASLGLPQRRAAQTLVPEQSATTVLQCAEHRSFAADCADRAVTLVRDRNGMLPLSQQQHRRLHLVVVTNLRPDDEQWAQFDLFDKLLVSAGFEVYREGDVTLPGRDQTIAAYRERVDAVVYCANMQVASNQTAIRLEWNDFLGDSAPKYARDLPTLFVSFSNPYHLVDVPMVDVYVNAYSLNEHTIRATVDKLLGRSEFVGINPVDPFAGLWDARR